MKPGENKGATIDGGIFTTDEGLKISIPPKNIIERDLLRKELLKMQEDFIMEIEASSCYVYKDEKGRVVKRTSEDGKVLTSLQNKKEEMDSER